MKIFKRNCQHHLRNIICKAVEKNLSRKLTQPLEVNLEIISRHYRVQCDLTNLTHLVNKEINLTVNYAKGRGYEFWHWLTTYHPVIVWLPVVMVLGGTLFESSFEGCLSIYMGRKYIAL